MSKIRTFEEFINESFMGAVSAAVMKDNTIKYLQSIGAEEIESEVSKSDIFLYFKSKGKKQMARIVFGKIGSKVSIQFDGMRNTNKKGGPDTFSTWRDENNKFVTSDQHAKAVGNDDFSWYYDWSVNENRFKMILADFVNNKISV